MNGLSNTQYQDLRQLAAARTPGHGLVGRFYGDPVVHEADLETIWFHGWLFVGHGCQLKTPGDYLTLQVGTEPVVVMPCGRCRQLLWENGGPEMEILTVSGLRRMSEVLPDAFGPDDLA